MSNYGIKVSKDGYNISSVDPLELSFNSNINTLKVFSSGNISGTITTAGTITVSHNIGYVPGYMVWYEVGNSGKLFFTESIEHLSGKNTYVTCSVGSANLNSIISLTGTDTIKIYYVLFTDPIE
jgi:hypothetical protein